MNNFGDRPSFTDTPANRGDAQAAFSADGISASESSSSTPTVTTMPVAKSTAITKPASPAKPKTTSASGKHTVDDIRSILSLLIEPPMTGTKKLIFDAMPDILRAIETNGLSEAAIARALSDKGIQVSGPTLKKWISQYKAKLH